MQPPLAGTSSPSHLSGGVATPPIRHASHTPPAAAATPARRPYLYVGQLSPQVNELTLREIFSSAGPVQSTKVVTDRISQYTGTLNYGFVEFVDVRSAELALQKLNGRKLFDSEIRVDWAASSLVHGGGTGAEPGTALLAKKNTNHHFHVFVGDLAQEVNDAALRTAFEPFASLSEARIMWDVSTGKSRGYGFVAFRDRTDAEQAIATMNGEWLGSRAIRVNWANQKGSNNLLLGSPGGAAVVGHRHSANAAVVATLNGLAALGLSGGGGGGVGGATSMPPTAGAASGTPITYDQALASAAPHNTTIYVGNIAPFATQNDLIPLFSQYGYIIEIRMQADRGYAFVKLDTHENAANAIVNLAGHIACGRPIKCGWGKDRGENAMFNALRQGMQLSGYASVAAPSQALLVPQYAFPSGFAPTSAAGHSGLAASQIDAATLQQLQMAQSHALQQQHHHQQQQQQQQQQHQQEMSTAQHLASQQPQRQHASMHHPLQYLHHQPQTHADIGDPTGVASPTTSFPT